MKMFYSLYRDNIWWTVPDFVHKLKGYFFYHTNTSLTLIGFLLVLLHFIFKTYCDKAGTKQILVSMK